MKLRALEALEDRPRKTMACPTANLLYSYFLDTALVVTMPLSCRPASPLQACSR